MIKGLIFDIKRFSIHDGPGIRSTVFFKGCPLNCQWCHNPESQSPLPERVFRQNRCIRCGACLEACGQGAISQNGHRMLTNEEKCLLCGECVAACYAEAREIVGREMTARQVMSEIERDIPFYDQSRGGVTLSGGEPLMQPAFLLEVLQDCKRAEIHTALDTCGYAPWETLDAIRRYVDLFLYDLKLMDETKHRQFTGVSQAVILRNLQTLSREGHSMILRVPLIPGVNDDDENMRRVAGFAAGLPHLLGVDLLPYHATATDKYARIGKVYELGELAPPSKEKLDQTAKMLRGFGLHVKMGG